MEIPIRVNRRYINRAFIPLRHAVDVCYILSTSPFREIVINSNEIIWNLREDGYKNEPIMFAFAFMIASFYVYPLKVRLDLIKVRGRAQGTQKFETIPTLIIANLNANLKEQIRKMIIVYTKVAI